MSPDFHTSIKQSELNDPGTRLSRDQVPLFQVKEPAVVPVNLPSCFFPITFTHILCLFKTTLLYFHFEVLIFVESLLAFLSFLLYEPV